MVCYVVLFTLKYALRMDIQLGFLLVTGLAALVIVLVFLKYTDSVKELKRVEKGINRIIMLHNRVKIRLFQRKQHHIAYHQRHRANHGHPFCVRDNSLQFVLAVQIGMFLPVQP